jgi:hypothetical protein
MPLPISLLQAAEQHRCFTGTYRDEQTVLSCLDPTLPLEPLVQVSCTMCFQRFGALASLLPRATTAAMLAADLTTHIRTQRGYAQSLGGFHGAGAGFWLSAAYFDGGFFLLDGSQGAQPPLPVLDLLADAIRQRLLRAADPRMIDPQHYALQQVYIDVRQLPPVLQTPAQLRASAGFSLTPAAGFQRVTLAEFLPLTAALSPAAPASTSALQAATPTPPQASPSGSTLVTSPVAATSVTTSATSAPGAGAPRAALRLGEHCPVCGDVVRQRELFSSVYIGCRCG